MNEPMICSCLTCTTNRASYARMTDQAKGVSVWGKDEDECKAKLKAIEADAVLDVLDRLPVGRYRTPEIEQGQGYPPFPTGLFARNRATPPPNEPPNEAFRAEFAKRFPSLNYNFIVTMEEIGGLGRAKYGDNCIEGRIARGDVSRPMERIYAREIIRHSCQHGNEYLDGIKHDVYKTRRHQLAAVAFNPMLEFQLAELENEPSAPLEIINR